MHLVNESVQAESSIDEKKERPYVSLATLFLAYFQIGLTAFGMAIIQKIKTLVISRHWLSEDEMKMTMRPGPK